MPSPFGSTNRARMMSNVYTTMNQGGGEKKAGFPHQIGRESWTSLFIRGTAPVSGNCCNLTGINTTLAFTTHNQTRPTWVRPGAAYGFQNIH